MFQGNEEEKKTILQYDELGFIIGMKRTEKSVNNINGNVEKILKILTQLLEQQPVAASKQRPQPKLNAYQQALQDANIKPINSEDLIRTVNPLIHAGVALDHVVKNFEDLIHEMDGYNEPAIAQNVVVIDSLESLVGLQHKQDLNEIDNNQISDIATTRSTQMEILHNTNNISPVDIESPSPRTQRQRDSKGRFLPFNSHSSTERPVDENSDQVQQSENSINQSSNKLINKIINSKVFRRFSDVSTIQSTYQEESSDNISPVDIESPSPRTQRQRDSRGRFISSHHDDQNINESTPNVSGRQRDAKGRFIGAGDRNSESIIAKAAENIGRAVKGTLGNSPQGVDPTIDAINEVATVLSPVKRVAGFMLRPLTGFFKNRKRNEPIPKEQADHNKEQKKQDKEQNKLLKRISDKVGGGGLLGGLLKGGAGTLGLLARLFAPVLAIGAAFFGGYKLGEIVREKVGEWVDTLVQADIPGRIAASWDTFTSGLQNYFNEKLANTKDKAESIVDSGFSVVDKGLAFFGNDAAQKRVKQRERGEIGHQSTATNNTSLGQVFGDAKQALMSQPASGKYAPLLNEIARGEARGGAFGTSGYDAIYSGAKVRPSKPISQMTIGEVKAYQQELLKAGSKSTAVGRYQFIHNKGAFDKMVTQAGLKDSDIFNNTAQDKLAIHYAGGEKQLDKWIETGNYTALTNKVAQQWASQKNSRGVGNYDGDKVGNKARHGGVDVMREIGKKIADNQSKSITTEPAPVKALTPKNSNDLADFAQNTSVPKIEKPVIPTSNLSSRATENISILSTVAPVNNVSTQSLTTAASHYTPPKLNTQIEPVKQRISSPDPQKVLVVNQGGDNISQNVGDRDIAHAITGGIGRRWDA